MERAGECQLVADISLRCECGLWDLPLNRGEVLIQKVLGVLQHQIHFACLDGRVANVHDAARTGGPRTGQYLRNRQQANVTADVK